MCTVKFCYEKNQCSCSAPHPKKNSVLGGPKKFSNPNIKCRFMPLCVCLNAYRLVLSEQSEL